MTFRRFRLADAGDSASDLLVIFGITGDLARKMTFQALYRLERRSAALSGPGGGQRRHAAEDVINRAREAINDAGETIDDDGVRPAGESTFLPARRRHRRRAV